MTDEITCVIEEFIRKDWSPEQIAGRLKVDGVVSLHHEKIAHSIKCDTYFAKPYHSWERGPKAKPSPKEVLGV